jgi:hypothetical protein
MKTRSDLQTDRYSVQLTTLYDSNQRHSFIMNKVALANTLRYIEGAGEMCGHIANHHGKDD